MMPCALPPVLWLHGRLGIRPRGMRPTPSEIIGHLVLWSFLAEGVAPLILDRSTRDPWDLLAYALGAVLLWMNHQCKGKDCFPYGRFRV